MTTKYYISKGSKEVYYTLRKSETDKGFEHDFHICTLAQDYDAAKEKAKDITGVECEFDPTTVGRGSSWVTTEKQEIVFDGVTFPFGKYSGKNITDIAKKDFDYLLYFFNITGSLAEQVIEVIKTLPEYIQHVQARLEAEQNKQAIFDKQQFLGQVGDKLKNIAVTLVKQAYFTTQFGTTYIYTFQDTDGNYLVYKGKHQDLHKTDKIVITVATVKEHTVYDNMKQTMVIRPKFEVDRTYEITCLRDAAHAVLNADSVSKRQAVLKSAEAVLTSEEMERLIARMHREFGE